jgi:perosamine synthetase
MIPWAKPHLIGNEKKFVLDALESTWISGGSYVDRFEKEFPEQIGMKYGVAVSNGTTALHTALLAAGIGPSDEVIVPGFTFVAPGNTVMMAGAKPVFVDIDPKTWLIDPKEVERNINNKTKAIIAVHLYGNVADMDDLLRIAKDKGIYLIEDVAEAVFSSYKSKYAGSFGDLGCFSFQATKTITMGEGGAVLTNSEKMYDKMRIIRSHGMREGKRYWHDVIGYNYRLTNLQAALGCAQLAKANSIIKEKKRVYNRYLKNLYGTDGIGFQKISDDVDPVIWAIAFKIDESFFKGNRDYLIAELLKLGIETRPGFYPFSTMPLYDVKPLPISEDVGRNVISPPSYPALKDDEIDLICSRLTSLMR